MPVISRSPRGRSIRFGLLLGALLCGPAVVPAHAQNPAATPAAAGVHVDSVEVRGNHRIQTAVILTTSGLAPGMTATAYDVQAAIRRLMATGNFQSVQIIQRGEPGVMLTLVIEVVEQPLIGEYVFQGLTHASAKTVRDTVGLKANQPLNPNQVARTETMVRQLLAKAGYQLRSIDTTLTPMTRPEGAYRLTFRVHEGQRLSITNIVFQGNQAFPDAALRGAMKTSREGFWWFRTGKFDREIFDQDLAKSLPEFYGRHGYIDFAVTGDTVIVDPENGKAVIQVTVSEGPQYRLGDFLIEGNTRFPTEQLAQIFTTQRRSVLGLPFGSVSERERGEIFDRAALDAATERVQQMYRNEGYLYAQVEPVVRRVPATEPGREPTVNVTWAISEQSPFYINTVTIEGNTFTHESVIRDRIAIYPGDVYDEERLLQSYRAISGLGYFETPMPTPRIEPNAQEGTVDVTFVVKEKQTGNISFGTSVGGYAGAGVSGFLGYTQPNLFGQGKQADVRAEYGYYRNTFQASYTDPSIKGSRNSGSVSLFHTDDRFRGFSFSDGRYTRTGGALQAGVPVPGSRWTRAFLGYSLTRYTYEAADATECDPGNFFCQPSSLASSLSLSLTRDTKNHPLFPTAGSRQSLAVQQTGGVLGGNGDFQKATGALEWWVPVGRLGGGMGARGIQMSLGLQTRAGALFGNATRFPLERFFMGGTMRGEQLRGYEELSITPSGYIPDNAAVSNNLRLGNAFLSLSAEYAIRFNDNLSLSFFGDAGNIWNNPQQINPTRLFRGAGAGVTIVTPFGPLGLDYAYGFDKTNPGFKLHFKLGGGF